MSNENINSIEAKLREKGVSDETLRRLESLDDETRAEALRQAAIMLGVEGVR